jgi:hypothetical protein
MLTVILEGPYTAWLFRHGLQRDEIIADRNSWEKQRDHQQQSGEMSRLGRPKTPKYRGRDH